MSVYVYETEEYPVVTKLEPYVNRETEVPLVSQVMDGIVSIPLHHYHKNRHVYREIEPEKRMIRGGITLKASFCLKPYQKKVEEFCTTTLLSERALFLNVRCGWGKTAMGIYLMHKVRGRCLILQDNQLIQSGWVNSFSAFTEGKAPVLMKSDMDYSYDTETMVFIAGVDTLTNIPYDHMPKDVNVVFVDEARCFCTEKRIQQMLKCRTRYLIGASADVARQDGMHAALDYFFGRDGETYIQAKWDGDFRYIRIFTDLKPTIEYTVARYGAGGAHKCVDWNKVLHSCSVHKGFNKFVVGLVLMFHMEYKILLLSRYTAQVTHIYKELHNRGVDTVRLLGSGKSHVDAGVVVATIGKAKKGYDVATSSEAWDGRHFDMVIILTDMESIEQAFGRGFRTKHPTIIDFIHDMPKLYKHACTRKAWCEERNATIYTENVRMEDTI